jgi:hypothetical protein
MKFPPHVDDARLTPNERRAKRLRYLINQICLERGEKASLREFERITKIDHSTFNFALKHHGKFTADLAQRVEKALNNAYPKEWFMDALSIPTDPVDTK